MSALCVCVSVCTHMHTHARAHTTTYTQPCPTICDSMDCSPPSYSVHGIFQARILERVAIPTTWDFPNPEINLNLLCLLYGRQILYLCTTWEAPAFCISN